jgi:hypothetical protein
MSGLNNEILQGYVKENALNSHSTEMPLKTDSRTRWSSLFNMVERYWDVRVAVDHTLLKIKSTITVTSTEKYILCCNCRTLKPVALTVEVRIAEFLFTIFTYRI